MVPSRSPNNTRSIDRRRLYRRLGGGALAAAALAYIGLVDPHNPRSLFPLCPFKALTGWNCPMCGGLRMLHDLLHADLAAAVVDNALLLAGLPMLATWVLLRRRRDPVLPIPAVLIIVTAAIAWTVLRNLPGFPLVPTVTGG
jgi:hypothetical protein